MTLVKDYYIDGLRTLAAKIGTMSAEGGPTQDQNYTRGMSPFEWVPSQLSRFLTDPTLAKLLEHPGQY